jgi:hypothetical protein
VDTKDCLKLFPYGPIHTVVQMLESVVLMVCAIMFKRFRRPHAGVVARELHGEGGLFRFFLQDIICEENTLTESLPGISESDGSP